MVSWTYLRSTYLTTPMLMRSIPVGIVIASGLVATIWTHDLLSDHQALVVHTFQAIDITKDVLIGLDDAETGLRGYLLSGDQRYLDPYEKALGRLTLMRQTLRCRISDNSDQVERVGELDELIDRKLSELKESIRLHDTTGFDAARTHELSMMEQATMDNVRRIIGAITESEKSLLATRQAEVDTDEKRIRLVAILIGLASFLTRAAIELYLSRRPRNARTVSS